MGYVEARFAEPGTARQPGRARQAAAGPGRRDAVHQEGLGRADAPPDARRARSLRGSAGSIRPGREGPPGFAGERETMSTVRYTEDHEWIRLGDDGNRHGRHHRLCPAAAGRRGVRRPARHRQAGREGRRGRGGRVGQGGKRGLCPAGRRGDRGQRRHRRGPVAGQHRPRPARAGSSRSSRRTPRCSTR